MPTLTTTELRDEDHEPVAAGQVAGCIRIDHGDPETPESLRLDEANATVELLLVLADGLAQQLARGQVLTPNTAARAVYARRVLASAVPDTSGVAAASLRLVGAGDGSVMAYCSDCRSCLSPRAGDLAKVHELWSEHLATAHRVTIGG